MTRHIPAHEVRYMTREFWWCDGTLHKHLSLAKAEECERNPNARSTQRGRKGRKRDGTF